MVINELSTFTIRGTVKAYKQLCPNSTVSEGSVRKAVASGELPVRKVGNTNYILWRNFTEWLDGRQHV